MATKKQRAKEKARNRAAKLRSKMKSGAEMSVTELEFLREYELNKGKPGRPKKEDGDANAEEVGETADAESEEADDDDEDGADGDPGADRTGAARADAADPGGSADRDPGDARGDQILAAANVGAAPSVAPPPPRVRPPRVKLSAPPRTKTSAHDAEEPPKSGSKGDWRAKYREGFGGLGGREATVTEIAKAYRGVLDALCEGMKSAGIEPRVDPAALYPSIVLVVDELLPAHVELTPKMIVVGGSTVLVVQRFINRKEIADVEKRKRDGDNLRARTEERKARVDDIAEQPQPANTNADPGAAAPDPVPEPAPPSPPAYDDRSGFRPLNNIPKMSSEELLSADPSAVL